MPDEHTKVFDLPVTCPNCHRPFIAQVSLDGVTHLILRWHPEPRSVKTGEGVIGFAGAMSNALCSLLLNLPAEAGKRLHLGVATNLGGPCIGDPAKPTAFGLQRVHPGVWVYDPSILVPGILHAFVVVVGVPEPAPWVDPFTRGGVAP